MTVESASYISGFNASYPASSDQKSEGDNHLRLIKSVLLASFPNVAGAVTVSHSDLNTVTLKANIASPAFTGTPTAPTATLGDNTTQIATTAFVTATAFSSALPGQTVDGKTRILQSLNGTASYSELNAFSYIKLAPLTGGTLTATYGHYSFMASASYTLPALTSTTDGFGLIAPTNATAVPSTVTTSDGWTVTTGFVAGTFRLIQPITVATAHGVWPGSTMTPPTLATITGSDNHTIIATAQIDTNLVVVIFRTPTGGTGTVYAAAINTSTNTAGAVATIGTWNNSANAANCVCYADSTTSFVVGFLLDGGGGARYKVFAASINTGTLAITFGAGVGVTVGTDVSNAPIKLANGLYALSLVNATDLYCFSVSGTTITMGAGVASGTVANGAKISRVSNTTFLAVYCSAGGGTAATRRLDAVVCSVSGTTITLNTAATGTNICADDIRLVKAYSEGSSYIACCKDGTTGTTGNYYGITTSGTTTTLGAVNAKTNNLPALYSAITYIFAPAEAVILYSSTVMLFGHLAAGAFAVSISGTTLTFGASGAAATTTTFLKDTATSSIFYAVGASAFDKLSVSGTTITSVWQVAAVPVVIQSDTLNDKAVSYSGTWYAWTLPTMQVAIQNSKWLYRSGNNLIMCGAIT